MEIKSILDVLELSWISFLFKGSEIIFVMLCIILSDKLIFWRMGKSLNVLIINSLSRGLSETLSIEVLTSNLGNIPSIAWHVLCFYIGGGTSDPVGSLV